MKQFSDKEISKISNSLKLNIFLEGNKFVVSDLKNYLDALKNFKYSFNPVQELGELRKSGPFKGKPSKFGMCWVEDISINQLKRIGPIFKTYDVEKIIINVTKKSIKSQTCLYLDQELISVAAQINASIEII